MQPIALRLNPQQDLKVELQNFITQHHIEAACIITPNEAVKITQSLTWLE
jgi:predicted DNA-binding protein with PD1-like motif